MQKTLTLFFVSFIYTVCGQEFNSDLYWTISDNSLSMFQQSAYTSMSVKTLRMSNQLGLVEEHTTTYKKGKINPERINFTINYTEFYLLEDRKKSIGKYEINANNEIIRYERTDYDNRNLRFATFYHYYQYQNSIIIRENSRIKEYIGNGAVEADSVVTKDSILYQITIQENVFAQKDLSEGGSTTYFFIENDKLIKTKNELTGFTKEELYNYDAKNRLSSIVVRLIGEDGKTISNITKIYYNGDNLISEITFEDDKAVILEKKVFTYK